MTLSGIIIRSRNIPILQYDLSGNFIKRFCSIKEAQLSLPKRANICGCLNGKNKQISGYIWKYEV